LVVLFWAAAALAQGDYPSRPVRIVVPSPPGGVSPPLGRIESQRLCDAFAG
jgi:tripartite-type tricarboxylate transporter receptor subunit TctC